jgi:hypothetical protein
MFSERGEMKRISILAGLAALAASGTLLATPSTATASAWVYVRSYTNYQYPQKALANCLLAVGRLGTQGTVATCSQVDSGTFHLLREI